MAYAPGWKSTVVADVETTFATSPGTKAGKILPYISCSIGAKQSLEENPVIMGTRNQAPPTRSRIDVSGQIAVPLDESAIGFWFARIFGAPTTTTVSTDKQHVFAPSLSAIKSFCLEKAFKFTDDTNTFELLNGLKVSKLSTTWGTAGFAQASIDVIGAKQTVGGTAYDSSATKLYGPQFVGSECTIEEGGSVSADVTECTFDLDCGLDGDMYGPSGTRVEILDGQFAITGALTAFFKDTSLLNKAINGTESSLKLIWTKGTHKLEILMPEVRYDRVSPEVNGPKGVKVQLNYRAYFDDDAGNNAIKVTLVNGVTSYA